MGIGYFAGSPPETLYPSTPCKALCKLAWKKDLWPTSEGFSKRNVARLSR